MLISSPFLSPSGTITPGSDDSREQAAQQELTHLDDYECAHGIYPVSYDRRWHGGVHLTPKFVNEPVRAIADGTIVAYRVSNTSVKEGHDNGFILIKHHTETGQDRPITFYSLYMHLAPMKEVRQGEGLVKSLIACMQADTGGIKQDGKTRVWRKDILGYVGRMYGHRMIHFEIFMEEVDFSAYFTKTLLGKNTITGNGDTELWGDIYYRIPGKTIVHDKADGSGNAIETDDHALFVRIQYDQGKRITTVWRDAGEGNTPTLITPAEGQSEPDYEYQLYDHATKRYPACASAGYELLRFGRIIGPDKDKLTAAQQVCRQRIPYAPGKTGYIDINAASIYKLSDADFPHFMGWAKISEGNGALADDGICDIKVILDVLQQADKEEQPPKNADQDRLASYLKNHEETRKKLRGLICHAPTEWDESTNQKRYSRLTEAGQFYEGKPDKLEKFYDYVKQFQFWDKTGLKSNKVWHFHPLEFIKHFRKCGWLSKEEISQLVPNQAIRTAYNKTTRRNEVLWEPVRTNTSDDNLIFKNHLIPLNQMMRKYGINTPMRQACFFGNAIQETSWMQSLPESGGKGLWYAPWYGRGFLQLTNPENYCNYWAWRGRKIAPALRDALVKAYMDIYAQPPEKRSNLALQDANFAGLTQEIKDWRNNIQALPDPDKSEEK